MSQTTAQQSEETLHEFRPKWTAWFWPIVLTIGFWTPVVWYQRKKIRYEVTTKRVRVSKGILTTNTDEILISEIKRISTNQSLKEKILGGGSITVDSGDDSITLSAVPNHERVAQSIRDAQ